MGRKGIVHKILMGAVAVSVALTGLLGSVPLPVRAAEEEKYTVTFEAYEGTCETESISVPKGESIILPEAAYEGHYLLSWTDVTVNGNVTTFRSIGGAGDTYTPERDLCLYANWKPEEETGQETEEEPEQHPEEETGEEPEEKPEQKPEETTGQETEKEPEQEPEKETEPGQDISVSYEARIGETYYEDIESAFADAGEGDTITVLKDCSASGTLEVTADNITLCSGDKENPATVRRDEEFSGKMYRTDAENVLIGVTSGSLALDHIIIDGGAVLDEEFVNTGEVWESPLIYVRGACAIGEGCILQNNYNTDYSESVNSSRSVRTAGALEVAYGGSLTMDGGLIQDCYTLGAGGGIQAGSNTETKITSGTIRHCYGIWGGALGLMGRSEISGMELYGNEAKSSGGAVWSDSELELAGCTVRDNYSDYDGGGASITSNYRTVVSGCVFTGNSAGRGSAIHVSGSSGTEAPVIRDCTIAGNRSDAETPINGSAINYLGRDGLVLDGEIVMEDNTYYNGLQNDIVFWFDDAEPIQLGKDFSSTSHFKLSGYEVTSGKLVIDATTNGKEADIQQFSSSHGKFRTEEIGGDIYFTRIYRILYILNETGYLDPELYAADEPVTILGRDAEIPSLGSFTRKDKVFVGWNTEKDGSGTYYAEGQEVFLAEDILYLYGKWEDKFTVSYSYNGGTGDVESDYSAPGYPAALPGASREGYRLKGWYEDEELTVLAGRAGEDYAANEDITLYAAWEKEEKAEATIIFDADGGKMEGGDITAKIGDTITLPACTKDDYEFAGWYDNDLRVGQAGEAYTVSGDVTLKAHYIKKEAPVCTVSFDTDGGQEISPVKVEKGREITLPEAVKEGCLFLGWYTEKEGGEKAGTEFTVAEDITLFARWEKEAEKPVEKPEATITFDADGGEMEGGDITAKIGDAITLPSCTKEGYEFVGWYDNDLCVGAAGEKYTVTGDATLKAHYEKKEETTYLITFDPNGGRKAEHIRAAKGEKITLPGTEKSGYVFLGWYTEKKGGILLGLAGDEMKVTKDMTVYALWEKEKTGETADKNPETCKAVFHTEGGTLKNKDITVVKGAGLYLPMPEKEGYEFAGWYLDQSLKQFAGAYRDVYRITKDTDFYAKWEEADESNSGGNDSKDDANHGNAETKEIYTVKYDANGGTVKESYAKVEKGTGIKIPVAEREGFAFKGWYTDKQVFVGKAGDTYQPEGNICLYARWEKAAGGNSSGGSADTGNSSDARTGAFTGTSGQDSKTGMTTGKSGSTAAGVSETAAEKEPVIQTGRTSPVYFLAALGMCGILLAAFSSCEGKRSSGK